jgi:hypothetical protein
MCCDRAGALRRESLQAHWRGSSAGSAAVSLAYVHPMGYG